ncbi:RNA polymerase sigma factor [Myxococcota bacterium]|nr:RNA polymerase sigma factor [Myxococcota bacterium]
MKEQRTGGQAQSEARQKRPPDSSATWILNPEQVPDAELVAGIKAGSEPHFNALYERYFSRVYAFAHSRMRSHSDAEEVSQETFVSVLTSIEKYRGQASLLSWIFGIAKNLSNNLIRKSSGQREKLGRIDPEHFVPQVSFGRGGPEEELTFQRYTKSLRREIEGVSEW